ncbi:beta-galactosidase [Streptomyces piniterrae]|uniref:beta-galactosidase n=1 Tax=Streptomyces piniterrae TaxID=2571125 RepID=UPI00145E9657|nr:beta-galactosidase [Streptomyces piniterrae]
MNSPRLSLLPGLNRPVVIGEYPYYRAQPERWAPNLRELRRLGVDVVSCYLPWRFHETDGERPFDFTGATDPQRNVIGLLDAAAEAGLGVLLKPGPFIHAEVQLGGLPDRLCTPERTPYTGLHGWALTSQGRPLPSLFDPAVREETAGWLRAVADEVIAPRLSPHGPVVAVQLGNEGICGDAHLPITSQDGGPHARAAFATWLAGRGLADASQQTARDVEQWSPELRALWSRWSGRAIADVWDWFSALLPEGVAKVVNVPLAPVAGPEPTIDAWAARTRGIAGAGYHVGHTEWVGNPSTDPDAFRAHLLGIRLSRSDVLEANWGFTWTDSGFAEARTPVFNSLLALMLGSGTVSVYTAVATGSWGAHIEMDAQGLLAEGVDPALHAPPYCPGAPTTESGEPGATGRGLRLLAAFLDRFGDRLLASELVRDAVLAIDRALPEAETWAPEADTALRQSATALHDVLLRRSLLVDPQWLDEDGTTPVTPPELPVAVLRSTPNAAGTDAPSHEVAEQLDKLLSAVGRPVWTNEEGRAAVLRRVDRHRHVEFIAVFNSTDVADRVTGRAGEERYEITVPPGGAVVAVISGGVLESWLATPAEPDGPAAALSVDGRPRDDLSLLVTT